MVLDPNAQDNISYNPGNNSIVLRFNSVTLPHKIFRTLHHSFLVWWLCQNAQRIQFLVTALPGGRWTTLGFPLRQ